MANQDYRLDRAVRHAVGLLRVSDGVARRIIAVLNKADDDIIAQLYALDPNEVTRDSYKRQRLEKLLAEVKAINADIYRQMRKALGAELKPVSAAEIEFQDGLLRLGTNTALSLPTPEQAYAAAVARPFQGRLLKEMYSAIEEGAKARLRDAIRMGFLQGESVSEVVKRIRGTRARNYQDGVLEINRKDAYRVARTAVAHTAAVAREAVNDANVDILQGIIWVSVLDSRTSDICRARSQKAYTVDGKPIGHNLAWMGGPGRAHWNCRSTDVPWLEGEEKPEGLSYDAWLKRQPAEVQRDILGPTRYKLWKDGGVPLDRFVERKGAALTIEQLRQQESEAFSKVKEDQTTKSNKDFGRELRRLGSDGNEHMIVVDKKGRQVIKKTSGQSAFVSISEADARKLDSMRGLEIHHNHPDDTSLSIADLAATNDYAGVESIFAHGHGGSTYSASVLDGVRFNKAKDTIDTQAAELFRSVAGDRTASKKDAVLLFAHVRNKIFAEAGIVDYSYNLSDSMKAIESKIIGNAGFRSKYNELVDLLR